MNKDKNSCNNKNCQNGKIASAIIDSDIEQLYNTLQSCDNCLQELMSIEEGIVNNMLRSLELSTASGEFNKFREMIDVRKAELAMKDMQPLPRYLQNYMDLSFQEMAENKNQSIVVKLTGKGIDFIDSILENMSLIPSTNFAPAMRSAVAESPEKFIVLEEQFAGDIKVSYQIIQESPQEAFLSIKTEPGNQLEQANLSKEGRFIQSSRFNSDGIVNFSGLQEGKYTVELSSKEMTKGIDLYILIN